MGSEVSMCACDSAELAHPLRGYDLSTQDALVILYTSNRGLETVSLPTGVRSEDVLIA